MAKGLTKAEQAEWEQIKLALEKAEGELQTKVEEAEALCEGQGAEKSDEELAKLQSDVRAILEDAHAVWVEALESAVAFGENIHSAAVDYFEGRTERWQEGEKGEEYTGFMEQWETVSQLETVKLESMIDTTAEGIVSVEMVELHSEDAVMAAPMYPGE